MPLRRCLREHTYRDLVIWEAHFESEWNERTKQDWYLAQIAAHVMRFSGHAAHPEAATTENKLIKFTSAGDKREDAEDVEYKKMVSDYARAIWRVRLKALKDNGSNG